MKDILLAALPAAIPTLTVFIALLINQVAISRLSWEIVDLRKQVNGDIASLRKQLHDDIVMLVGRDTDKSERLARLEERSKG
jgi:hypothetical protein